MQHSYKNPYLVEDEGSLWQEFSEGSELAYERIYHRHAGELYRYAYMVVRDRALAEDVIHDVFTDLWSSRKGQGKIRAPRLYLFSCVKRRALRKLKKERQYSDFELAPAKAPSDITRSMLDELIDVEQKEELVEKIRTCLENLSNRQREIIYLRFYQNMSYEEISELLQLDQKYVYNLSSKAFGLLRKSLPPLYAFYVWLITEPI